MPSAAPQVEVPDSPSSQASTGPEFLIAIAAAAGMFVLSGSLAIKFGCFGPPRNDHEMTARPLLLVDDDPEECGGNIEFESWSSRDTQSSAPALPSSDTQLRMTDQMVSLMGSSPAPTFAIGEDFRIKLWSPGECQSITILFMPSFLSSPVINETSSLGQGCHEQHRCFIAR